MEYSVVNKINIRKHKCIKVGAFLYDNDLDGLYLDMPWPFPVQLGITHGLSKCEVTPMFVQLPFIMKGWINESILLRQIELLKLALTGRILMHASCVDDTLIVGLPNSGKTYHTYDQVARGGKLISEEYTIIRRAESEMSWCAQPYKKIMRTCFSSRTIIDCNIDVSLRERLWLFVATIRATLLPFMYEAVIWKEIPVSGEQSIIKKIVYGSSGREVKDWKEFAILCENEFPFMSSEFLQAYSIITGFNILGVQATQRKLIKEFVENVYPTDGK